MSRIDLVSKNLLTSSIRSFSKKDVKKTAIKSIEEIANFAKIAKVTRIFIAMWKDWATNMAKIARTTNLTKFYTFWTYLYPKITFYCLRQCYIYRWFIHPWIMKDSSPTTSIGKTLGGPFPYVLYSFLNTDWIGAADYSKDCSKDPCLITGIVLFVEGFIINRYADLSLRKLRTNYSEGYSIPHDCCFWSHIMP